jgi:mRNA interferase YafQ
VLKLVPTTQYKKDRKRAIKQGKNMKLLDEVLEKLCAEKTLDPKRRDHALSGDMAGFRECHVQSDWLLIYAVDKGQLILTAARTGSHSDLLNK